MDQFSNSDVIGKLQELGLTAHEALIYVAVLRNGECSAGVILDEVKLHREQVYRALKRLVDEGYLTQYEKRKRSYFSAVNPDIFINQAKTKVSLAESVAPYLSQIYQAKPQIIRVWEGEDSIKIHLEDLLQTLPDGGEYLILGSVGEGFYKLTEKYGDYFTKRFAKKNIRGRIIFFEGEKPSPTLSYGETWSVKTIKKPSLSPVSTVIYSNKVSLEWLKEGNNFVINIENEEIADSYRQTFEALWK
jgi:HTH-type transcriptional regulator, sugar sensing transcriptional regulator